MANTDIENILNLLLVNYDVREVSVVFIDWINEGFWFAFTREGIQGWYVTSNTDGDYEFLDAINDDGFSEMTISDCDYRLYDLDRFSPWFYDCKLILASKDSWTGDISCSLRSTFGYDQDAEFFVKFWVDRRSTSYHFTEEEAELDRMDTYLDDRMDDNRYRD
jgi:hypothetical protein